MKRQLFGTTVTPMMIITSDLLLGAIPVLVWMVIEARLRARFEASGLESLIASTAR
jgi:hypothetical protein